MTEKFLVSKIIKPIGSLNFSFFNLLKSKIFTFLTFSRSFFFNFLKKSFLSLKFLLELNKSILILKYIMLTLIGRMLSIIFLCSTKSIMLDLS